jgi:glutamyl-tRNA synthetase
MTVVTRFAPSPTGFLHIGGARTALFNWLYARHHGGRFMLRIEDTDRARSSEAAVRAILDGLEWLGLDWDGAPVRQFARAGHHAEVARALLEQGKAYRCYCTPEELAEMRERARAEGRSARYDGRWRDRDPSEAPAGVPPAIRLKAPLAGETVIDDLVQGRVTVLNRQLDDMILLRADGTPTYMLSVVVDDHDMGVTHVIRGDDHLNNAFRQAQLYRALGWEAPALAHIPLIHGSDGARLSKRHGALGIEAYRAMGYLPEALRNTLLRLGWSHGDDEVIATEQAIAWFDLDGIGRSPARFDLARLESLNGVYMRAASDERLVGLVLPFLEERLGHRVDTAGQARLRAGIGGLKPRANTLVALADAALFYAADATPPLLAKAARLLDAEARARLGRLADALGGLAAWDEKPLEAVVRAFAETEKLDLGRVAQPLRAALTGATASPGIFEVMAALGRDQVLARLSTISN